MLDKNVSILTRLRLFFTFVLLLAVLGVVLVFTLVIFLFFLVISFFMALFFLAWSWVYRMFHRH